MIMILFKFVVDFFKGKGTEEAIFPGSSEEKSEQVNQMSETKTGEEVAKDGEKVKAD